MNGGTYSNEYLRSLPQKMRKEYVRNYVSTFEHQVLSAARNGLTSCTFKETNKNNSFIASQKMQSAACGRTWEATPPTQDEIIEILREMFPNSKVTYEEKWVDISRDKKELQKGICVDWSE